MAGILDQRSVLDIMGLYQNNMPSYPLTNKANAYARSVISGKIHACLQVRQACQRHMDDMAKSKQPSFPYKFDKDKAEAILYFGEQMPHVKGKWAGQKIQLEPWQCFCLGVLFGWVRKDDNTRRFNEAFLLIPRKNGKALALETEIPTPGGFKRMSDIVPGDIVFGSDGKQCNVVAVTPAQTGRPCREVVFKTGEAIVADDEHEWVTDSATDRDNKKGVMGKTAGPKPSIKTTAEIANTLIYGKGVKQRCNHRVMLSNPVEYGEKKLPIDPYVLGYWLGDGAKDSPTISCSEEDIENTLFNLSQCGVTAHQVEYSKKEGVPPSIWVGRVGDDCVRGHSIRHRNKAGRCMACEKETSYARKNNLPIPQQTNPKIITILRKMGVLNNKHIPEIYLIASIKQRTALVQGLMDSDGFCSMAGQCEFTTTSIQLRDGFIQLIASLGLKSKVLTYRAMMNGKDCGEKYRIFFFAYKDTPVFRLKRKSIRQKTKPKKPTRTSYRYIESANRIESVPVKCIEVDSPDNTYLVGRSYIPTHNSTIAAIVGLYMFSSDGEEGAEVYCAAGSEAQAYEVFRPAWTMVNKMPDFKEYFNVQQMGTIKNPGNIFSVSTGSRFETVIGKPGDGSSPHLWIQDELHEAKTSDSYDTGKTGMGARTQPLMFVISTAGTNTAYPCYSMQKKFEQVLSGDIVNDDVFVVVYTVDKEDDWTQLETWKKANPNYGVSVSARFIESQLKTAVQDKRKQNILKCKHLNMWSNAGDSWMNMVEWDKCYNGDMKLEDFSGEPVFVGLDLASKIDIAAKIYLFKRGDEYFMFARYYIPEDRTFGEDMSHYAGWVHDGYMESTPGARIDIDAIQESIKQDAKDFDLSGSENGGGEVCNDPWNAQQLITNLMTEKIACVEVSQTVTMLSEPMKEVEAAVKSGKFHHDGNPVTDWMVGNVCCRVDKKDNIFPFKEGEENKIDGAVALITAMARAMYEKGTTSSVYETGEVFVL